MILILVINAKVIIPFKIWMVQYLVVYVFKNTTLIQIIIVKCVIILVNHVFHQVLNVHLAIQLITEF